MTRRLKRFSVLLGTCVLVLPIFACNSSGDADYADRMAEEHAADTTEASPLAEVEPAAEIETKEVVYATVEGNEVTGFVAQPVGVNAGTPGVLVIQEWWGLNDNIRSMAERLAGEGYIALAVDLYEGEVATDRDAAYALMQASFNRFAALQDNLRQAHAFLTDDLGAGDTGSIGWCFGGGWSLQSALLLPGELDATVMFYGQVETDSAILEMLETPIVGFFGAEDQGIPVDGVREFEAALSELGKSASIHYYEGVGHAFANPTGNNYDAAAAEDSWSKTLEFFRAALSPGSDGEMPEEAMEPTAE